jgi:hypothetical protein
MTLTQIEKRVKALETKVRRLAETKPIISRQWYRTEGGRFANDPIFEEIVKLGRAYRKAQGRGRHLKRP